MIGVSGLLACFFFCVSVFITQSCWVN